MEFSPEAADTLGHYVYALCDPRHHDKEYPERIFYIGKGSKNRCWDHAKGEVQDDRQNPTKLETIRDIKKKFPDGPTVEIVAYGLEKEEAFRLESLLIALGTPLTNAVSGHHKDLYWNAASELNNRLSNPLIFEEIAKPTLFVSLNGNAHLPSYPAIAEDDDALRAQPKIKLSDFSGL